MTTPTLSAKDVAEKFGIDAKMLRVFLRSITYAKNAEGRYSFPTKDVPALKAQFNKWAAEREAASKAKTLPRA
ncbi:hypothetical protein PP571_23505 [Mycobacteroides abscessus]|nr:hypothetical protein [Mycobacteroides abscessus]MDM2549950.1 hypothetical protein [Mycobacteroides abscessus]MDM2558153.1 hypothetical protein [Mycobacteroides abscessus]MDM2563050.1 hypothetical protein [Mycobacteroides abscessus]MDM2578265.1 hypothetical protein [Mycobacteroides abscessus]